MSEIALISVRKSKLEIDSRRGNKKAIRTLKLLNSPDKFLSTVQIGVTTVSLLTGIFSGASIQKAVREFLEQFDWLASFSGPLSTVIVLFFITYLTLVLGELVPKRIGLSNPEKIAEIITPLMNFVSKVAFPFIWLFSVSTEFIIRLFGIKNRKDLVTEEEIKSMVEEGTKQGEIKDVEQDMIEKVFSMGDRRISSLMTYRDNIKWLEINMERSEFVRYVRENLHSNYPVCEKNIDDIKGIVLTKHILTSSDETKLADLCRPALFVPGNVTAYRVMERMQKMHTNVCFIIDEYGDLEGMVTLKDILEAIVGDVHGEDEVDKKILPLGKKTYLIESHVGFYDFLDYFDCQQLYYKFDQLDTLAGFILDYLGYLPKEGETFEWNHMKFSIEKIEGNRIDKVKVTLI